MYSPPIRHSKRKPHPDQRRITRAFLIAATANGVEDLMTPPLEPKKRPRKTMMDDPTTTITSPLFPSSTTTSDIHISRNLLAEFNSANNNNNEDTSITTNQESKYSIKNAKRRGLWAAEDDEILISERKKGTSFNEIAEMIPRHSETAIRTRWYTTYKHIHLQLKAEQQQQPKILFEQNNSSTNEFLCIQQFAPFPLGEE
jgi:hypothetical protein